MELIKLNNAIIDYFIARPSFSFVSVENYSTRYKGCPFLIVKVWCRSKTCYMQFDWKDRDIFNGYLTLTKIF